MKLKSNNNLRYNSIKMSKIWESRRISNLLKMLYLWTKFSQFSTNLSNLFRNLLIHLQALMSTVEKSKDLGLSTSYLLGTISLLKYCPQSQIILKMKRYRQKLSWLITWKGLLLIKPYLSIFLNNWRIRKCTKIHMILRCSQIIWWIKAKYQHPKMFFKGRETLTKKASLCESPKIYRWSLTMLSH